MKQAQTLSMLFSLPGSTPAIGAGDLWRSPRPADQLCSPKKTAVCSGCRTRYRIFSDRRPRRVRDTDAACWRIYVAYEHRRVACVCCRGVTVERLDWLAQNLRSTQRFARKSAP
jgi:transposase